MKDGNKQAIEQLGEVKPLIKIMTVQIECEGNVVRIQVPADKNISPTFDKHGEDATGMLTGIMIY